MAKTTQQNPFLTLFGVVILAVAAGCSSPSNSAAEDTTVNSTIPLETTTTTTPRDAAKTALAYFEAFAEHSRAGLDQMRDLAVPASPAWQYFYHQERIFISERQTNGEPRDEETARVVGDKIKICKNKSCVQDTTYSNFKLRGEKLVSFDVEGRKLKDLIQTWHKEPTGLESACHTQGSYGCNSEGSLDIHLRSMYRTAQGNLIITFDWKRGLKFQGSLRNDAIRVNREWMPSTELIVTGIHIGTQGYSSPTPEPGGFTVGYYGFEAPPNGSAEIIIQLRNSGTLLEYNFAVEI
jgi:hypothetical protein